MDEYSNQRVAVPRDRHTQACRHSTAALNLLGLRLSFLIYSMEILTALCPEVYVRNQSACSRARDAAQLVKRSPSMLT